LTLSREKAARGFSHVETWVFDLDNTLYPHHLNLWQQVDERIRAYVSDFLKVSADEAFRVQKDYYLRYGTTMRGMMTEHGMKPDDYLEFVHQIDHSPLEANPALGAALEKLPGRKLILTNGTRKHADAVMQKLKTISTSRTCSTSLPQTSIPNRYRRYTIAFLPGTASMPQRQQCSRISRATWKRHTRWEWQPCSLCRKGSAKYSAKHGNWKGAMRPMSII
jgi:hypothetical protein